jgi:hypothetical protein
MKGVCIEVDSCTGAAIVGDCISISHTCCVNDINLESTSTSVLISRDLFLKIAGNTKRNQAFYGFFVDFGKVLYLNINISILISLKI